MGQSNLSKKIQNNLLSDKDEILKRYSDGDSYQLISEKYNCDKSLISNFVKQFVTFKRRNSKSKSKRKYTFKYDYFNKIDTKDKAYFLGLFYADGYNSGKTIRINLQQRDGSILEKFNYYVNNTRKLSLIRTKNGHSDLLLFEISSVHLCDKLTELGCPPKKSLILKFPTEEIVPKHLQNHFIRGYFDGDGCIHVVKYLNRVENRITILGTKDFLQGVSKVIFDNCNTNVKNILKQKNIFSLKYNGNLQTRRIYNYLYKDCEDLYLERKKEKFV